MDSVLSALAISLVGSAVAFAIYRRFRRNFGRQPVNRTGMIARVAIFGVAAPVLLHACSSPWGFAAAACGALTGSALAWLGLRLTAHESTPEGQFYTTNAWIAATVSVLFLGRIASRFLALYTLAEAGDAGGISAGDLQTSPLTLGSSFVLVGYYVVYFGGVLWRVRGVTRLATDPAPTPAAR